MSRPTLFDRMHGRIVSPRLFARIRSNRHSDKYIRGSESELYPVSSAALSGDDTESRELVGG